MNADWSFSKTGNIYQQIVEKLKRKIVSGEFSPGDKLPSVRSLSEEANVNPNTMMRALADLESKKLLYTLRGSGKYVTGDLNVIRRAKEELTNDIMRDFINDMYELGLDDEEVKKSYYNVKNGGI